MCCTGSLSRRSRLGCSASLAWPASKIFSVVRSRGALIPPRSFRALRAETVNDELKRAAQFVSANVGKDWTAGAQGPDVFDCWGLARTAQRVIFGRELPEAGLDVSEIDDVRKVARAIEQTRAARTDWTHVE